MSVCLLLCLSVCLSVSGDERKLFLSFQYILVWKLGYNNYLKEKWKGIKEEGTIGVE